MLDAAVTSVVVSAVTSTETPAATPPSAAESTAAPALNFYWTPPAEGDTQAAATSAELAQGAGANASPFLVVPLDQNVNEGQLLDLSGLGGAPPLALFVDIDLADTHTATVNWGDGSATENATVFPGVGSGALGGTHTYADQGTYTVTITVLDNNGGSDIDTFDVIVAPVAPTATLGNSGPVTEGSSATVSFSNQFDPSSADTTAGFHYAYDVNNDGVFDVGDGTYAGSGTSGSQNISASLLIDGPGDYTIKGRIIDKDGQFTDYLTVIHVDNVPPTLTNIVGDTINENDIATIRAKIVDPGTNDVFSVQVNWLDGTSDTISGLGAVDSSGTAAGTTYQWTAATRQLDLSHQYLDDGLTNGPQDTYNVSLNVSDDDLGATGPYVAPVVVNNVAPFVVAQLDQLTSEGQLLDLSGIAGAPHLALFADPGTLDSHTATVDWGDGSAVENAAVFSGLGSGVVGGTHVYADDGLYKVTVTVTDKDGESDSATFFVTVGNIAPTLIVPGPQNVVEGNPLVITNIGTITDPGFDNPANPNSAPTGSVETFTYWISWGDGHIDTGTATIDDVGGPFDLTNASFDGTHTYADNGPYTVTVRIADDNMTANFVGGVNGTDFVEQQFTVNVGNDIPQLVDVTGSTILENGIASVSATIVDDGAQDVFSVDVNWQDGTSDAITGLGLTDTAGTVGGTAYTWIAATRQLQLSHQYLDDGSSPGNGTTQDDYGVALTPHDDDLGTGVTQIATVTVQNVKPSVALDAVSDINENGTATLTGSYTDIGRVDAHTVTVNWADPNDGAASTFAVSAVQNLAGVPTLSVGQTFNSSTDSAVLTITAINAATGQVSFSVQHQYLDDGLALGNGTTSDVSIIGVSVADDDAQSGSNAASVTVHNVTPSVALSALPDINENGAATLTGSYTDIGRLDAHTLTVNWNDPNNGAASTFAVSAIQNAAGVPTLSIGQTFNSSTDGAVLTITAINSTTGQVSFSVQHQYLDDGLALGNNTTSDTVSIVVTVADDDAQSGNNKTAVTIHNVAPSVSLNSVADINENGVATATGSYTDIGRLDSHTLTVSWADANNGAASTFAVTAIQNAAGVATLSVGQTFNSSTDGAVLTITAINAATGQVSFSVQHQYLDDGLALGNNTISDVSIIGVTVADDDAQSGNNTTTVTVHNVTPSVALGAVSDINENGVATLTGSYTDIGRLDAHVLTVDWADTNNATDSTFNVSAIQNAAGVATLSIGQTFNSTTDGAVLTITAINAATGQVSFSVQHQYLDDGLALGNNTISDVSIIGVTVADDDAQSGNNTTSVTVHNVTPSVVLGAISDINENGVATITGSYTDIGRLDAHTLTVNWADPNNGAASTFAVSAIQNAAGVPTLSVGQTFNSSTDGAVLTITAINAASGQVSFSVQHQYLDDGLALGNNTISDVSIIGITVADDDAQSGNNATSVTVHNVTPSVALGAVSDINENGVATLTGSYTDIGRLDAHVLTVDWADTNNATDSTFNVSAIQNASGVPTLSVGQTFNSSTDGAVLTITAINAATGQVSFSVQHQYLDDGLALGNNTISDVSIIGVTVADDDAQSGNNTASVTVHNVTPNVALNSVPDVNENGTATLTGSYTDIGRLDAHTLTVDWADPNNIADSTFSISAIQNAAGVATLNVGDTFNSSTDGAVLTITAINATTGQVSFSVQHQYLDDGLALGNGTASDVSIIGVTVADDDAQSGNNTVSVTVHNVSPTVTLSPVAAINENGIATVTGGYTDIGLLDAHTLTVDWGDPNNAGDSTFAVPAIRNAAGVATLLVGDTFNSSTDGAVLTITAINAATGQVSFSVQHQYLDDGLAPGNGTINDTSTILVAVLDDDGQSGGAMSMVTVNNVAPGLALNPVPDINENGVATLTGSYTDIGLLDGHTLTVDWADPNNHADSTFTIDAIRDAAGVATLVVGDTFNSVTDSAVLTITAINSVTGQVSFSVQHQYLDDGLAPGNGTTSDVSLIDVSVFDDDTGSATTGTTVLVRNVAPTVALNPVTTITENGTANLSGSYTDIGLLDGHVITIDWNDPNDAADATFTIPSIRNAAGVATLAIGDTFNSTTDEAVLTITSINSVTGEVGFSVSHQYLDDGPAPGNNTASDTSTIVVTAVDDDGQNGNDSENVLVNNALPGLSVNGPVARNEGQLLDLTGSGGLFVASFTDIGSLDLHKAQINWGDGHIEASTVAEASGNGTVAGSHTFADDGTYLVTIRVADDDMGAFADTTKFATGTAGVDYVEITFTVTVSNVSPSLTDTNAADNTVAEGTAFVLSSLGGPQQSMGVGLSDPGFDNPLNTNPLVPPAIGNQFAETFTGYMIDWGDGTADTPVTIVNRVSGSPGTLTTAQFQHAAHTYADDGVYTVRIRLADDNMSGNFTTGTNGVDFVDLEFTITVTNVNPTLAAPAPSAIDINENGAVSFTVSFTDPGFDNLANNNTPANGGETAETFTYDIDWGDGRHTVAGTAVAASDGAVGVPSAGSFGENHIYADDGNYTVTVTVHDDDGGSNVRTFIVSVHNVAPSITQPLEGDEVNTQGITRIRFAFSDPGFDNPTNQTPPPNGDQFQESFTYQVDWGDGTIDIITVSQVAPGSPLIVNSQTTVLSSARTSGNEGIVTTGSFEVEHRYLGPPDPLHPTADINITVTLIDDNGGTVVDAIAVGNPGIQVINVAIDTTPDVPRLELVQPPVMQVFIDRSNTTPQSLVNPRVRVANSELAATSDRYLELQVISPDDEVLETHRLSDDALADLRALIATLPDNHYKIYLVRTDNDSHRLVLDVYVRRGHVVDPSDDSEGTRDKPPTDDVQQNKVVPLKDNPFIEEAPPAKPDGAMLEQQMPVEQEQAPAGSARLRWAIPAAGIALIAQRGSWSEEIDTAFDEADEHQWQRLRRAGRVRKRK